LKDFLRFIISIMVWAVIGRFVLQTGIAHPMAIGIVWIVGFVWITGWVAGGDVSYGDEQLKVTLIGFGGALGFGAVVVSFVELWKFVT